METEIFSIMLPFFCVIEPQFLHESMYFDSDTLVFTSLFEHRITSA
jgi:hypothetical protein